MVKIASSFTIRESRSPAFAAIATSTTATSSFATTAAAAAAAAATPTTAASTTEATTATTRSTLLCHVDDQRAAIQLGTIHLFDRRLGCGFVSECLEAEAA